MGGRIMGKVATDGAEAIKSLAKYNEVAVLAVSDPNTSVLNQYCQSWQVPIFSLPTVLPLSLMLINPTLSIMANVALCRLLSARNARTVVEREIHDGHHCF